MSERHFIVVGFQFAAGKTRYVSDTEITSQNAQSHFLIRRLW